MRLLRISLLACVLILGAACAGSAAAAIPQEGYGEEPVLDGTDYYWLSTRSGSGCRDTTRLWRRSVFGGAPHVLRTFKTGCFSGVDALVAGGGRVAFDVNREGVGWFTSKIVVMDRDGRSRKVIAKATLKAIDTGRRNDIGCGTILHLKSASPTGGIVIGKYSPKRPSARCGRHHVSDKWEYSEIAPDGSRRLLHTEDMPMSPPAYRAPLDEIQVNGSYAMMLRSKSLRVSVKNLVTGAVTSPFIDSITKRRGKVRSKRVSLSPVGDLMISSWGEVPGEVPPPSWTDLFVDPADRMNAARSPDYYSTAFCGNRVFGTRLNMDWDNFPEADAFLSELDPATLAPIRNVVNTYTDDEIVSCTATHAVLSSESEKFDGYELRAVPLG